VKKYERKRYSVLLRIETRSECNSITTEECEMMFKEVVENVYSCGKLVVVKGRPIDVLTLEE